MNSALSDLVNVRSRPVEEVLAYLDAVAAEAAELPKYFPKHLREGAHGTTPFDDIRQVVQVVEDRGAFDRWRAEERERLRAAGHDVDTANYAPWRARRERSERDDEWEDEGDDDADAPIPVVWDERAGERFRRAVILGDPGFGKTWLLRYEARRVALGGAVALRDGRIALDELLVPLSVYLPSLKGLNKPLAGALVQRAAPKRSTAFDRFLRAKLETERCVVLLDAWDEVPAARRDRLGERLEDFARGYPGRLLVASRIVGYTKSPIPDADEVELLAFDPRHVEAFVRLWFRADDTRASEFLALLRRTPQLRGLARIPLMLALMCRVYEEARGKFPTRRVELYDRCVRGLLGEWQAEKPGPEVEVEPLLEAMETIALAFQLEGHKEINETALRAMLLAWLASLPRPHELHGAKVNKVIGYLKRGGVLIKAGLGEHAPILFLHRTFQEYGTASALSERPDWFGVALDHLYDPAWHEVLVLLGGLLGPHTGRYVSALLRENANDLLCRPLELASAAAANAREQDLPRRLLDALVAICFQLPPYLTRPQRRALLTPWGARILPKLLDKLDRGSEWARVVSAEALGWIGAQEAVPLLTIRANQEEDLRARVAAVEALGWIGAQEAVPAILRVLGESEPQVRHAGVEALGWIGAQEAVPAILRVLGESEDWVRHTAVEALVRLGASEVVPILLDWATGYLEKSEFAVEALGRLGVREGVPVLLRLLDHAGPEKYAAVVAALARLGAPEVVPVALHMLESPLDWLRHPALEALARRGAPEVVPVALAWAESGDPRERAYALEALGRLGAPEVVPVALRLLEAPEGMVRHAAVNALGRAGGAEAIRGLLHCVLNEEDDDMSRSARVVLRSVANQTRVPISPGPAGPFGPKAAAGDESFAVLTGHLAEVITLIEETPPPTDLGWVVSDARQI